VGAAVFEAVQFKLPSKRLHSNVNGATVGVGIVLTVSRMHATFRKRHHYTTAAPRWFTRFGLTVCDNESTDGARRSGLVRAPGQAGPAFRHDDLTYGIAICADIHDGEVFAACAQQSA
jgi:hypothetical protein